MNEAVKLENYNYLDIGKNSKEQIEDNLYSL